MSSQNLRLYSACIQYIILIRYSVIFSNEYIGMSFASGNPQMNSLSFSISVASSDIPLCDTSHEYIELFHQLLCSQLQINFIPKAEYSKWQHIAIKVILSAYICSQLEGYYKYRWGLPCSQYVLLSICCQAWGMYGIVTLLH